MTHLRAFRVERYRGISGLSLPTLNRLNLITGKNGIGKTALLESMWLFTNKNIKGSELLQATPEGLVSCRVTVDPNRPEGIFVGTVQDIDTSQEVLGRYSSLVRTLGKSDLESAMQFMFKGNPQVEILTSDSGKPYLAVSRNNGRPLPLRALGGGAVKFFSLYLNFFAARNGLVFFDEIENGVHHSLFKNIWKFILEWSKRWNVQFFGTTHSREFIRAAVEAHADQPDELSVHNLFMKESDQTIDAITYAGDTLLGADDLRLEVR